MKRGSRARRSFALTTVAWTICIALATEGPAAAIRGGEVVNTAPSWTALVIVNTGPFSTSWCSGALIAPSVVLTAAHCVATGPTSVVEPKTRRVVVGRADLNGSGGVESGLSSIVVHPEFDYASLRNDFALLFLEAYLTNAPLPLVPSPALYGDKGVTLYGYGTVDASGHETRQLRRTPDHAYRIEACGAVEFVCFRRHNVGVEVLPGDSGAPWVLYEKGGWVHIAVHSGGGPDLEQGARTGNRLSWIRDEAGLVTAFPDRIFRDPNTAESWLIGGDGFRRSIPTGGDYICLVNRGSRSVNLPRELIEQVPNASGELAICTPGGGGGGGTTIVCTIDRSSSTNAQRIAGTSGDDVVCGSPFADDISSGGGTDIIYGGAGNDRIAGGDGGDKIYAGNGNDQVSGGAGNDSIDGEGGNDTSIGGDGVDSCIAETAVSCERQ